MSLVMFGGNGDSYPDRETDGYTDKGKLQSMKEGADRETTKDNVQDLQSGIFIIINISAFSSSPILSSVNIRLPCSPLQISVILIVIGLYSFYIF